MKSLPIRLLFNTLKVIIAVLPLAIWAWYFEFEHVNWLSKFVSLVFPLTIGLLLEATRQPQDDSTPFYKMIGRFSTLRDRLVSLVALILFLTVLSLPLVLTLTWQINLILIGVAVLVYYVIGLVFGTKELRDSLKPKWPEIW